MTAVPIEVAVVAWCPTSEQAREDATEAPAELVARTTKLISACGRVAALIH